MTLQQIILTAISVSIFLTVFAIGLHAEPRDVTFLLRRPHLLCRSILSMNVVMIVFAVVVAASFDLHPAIKIAILALAASPVPPIMPKKVRKVRESGNYGISLLVTTVLLAVVLTPASVELVGRFFDADAHIHPGVIARVVFMSAILPLIVGMLVRYFVPGFAERIGEGLIKISTVLLAIAVLPILVTNAPSVWSMIGSGVIVVLVLFTSVGLVAGHLLGGPNPDDRTVLALATCTRHPGVALAIAGLNFPEHKPTVMVIVLCHLIIGVVATVLYKAWRKRGQAARPAATRP